MFNSNKIYLSPEPHEKHRNGFGSDFVANEKYLAVGYTGLNKVIIYTPNNSGKWSRTREILPPANLPLDGEGSIYESSTFGYSLEIDGDVLTISARIRNPDVSSEGLSRYQAANTPAKYSYRRYLINLKTETEVKPIDLLVQREPESNLVRFNLLCQGKIEQFVLPNMGEEYFGRNVALHQNLLLVGYLSYGRTGGAWLFDLDRPQAEPQKLAIEDTTLGGTVAISQQFAAVGNRGIRWYFARGDDRSFKTLIRNLNNGSTNVIRSFGELSLSGNILAVMRPCNREEELAGLLQVFRLDENTMPHLIRRTNVAQAKVQNGFLITLKTYYREELCIEPLF